MSGVSPQKSPEEIACEFNVSRESLDRLKEYVRLLAVWQSKTNLVGPKELERVWPRHIADALQLVALIDKSCRCIIDLGSGAGIPGIILAIAVERPGFHVHLVESNKKKAAFLREVSRVLGLSTTVHDCRIEAMGEVELSPAPDLVVSRALAPLEKLLGYAYPWIKNGAKALFHKGQDVDRELTETTKYWIIEAQKVPNRTDANGCILSIKDVQRVKSVSSSNSVGKS